MATVSLDVGALKAIGHTIEAPAQVAAARAEVLKYFLERLGHAHSLALMWMLDRIGGKRVLILRAFAVAGGSLPEAHLYGIHTTYDNELPDLTKFQQMNYCERTNAVGLTPGIHGIGKTLAETARTAGLSGDFASIILLRSIPNRGRSDQRAGAVQGGWSD